MRALSLSLLFALAVFAAGCGSKPDATGGDKGTPTPSTGGDDLASLQGTWKAFKHEIDLPKMNGKDNPFKELVDEIFGKLEITVKDKVVSATVPGEKGEKKFIIALDSSKSPKHLDLTEADDSGKPKLSKKMDGFDEKTKQPKFKEGPPDTGFAIFKIEGDTLVVAMEMGDDKSRPTAFKASPGKDGSGVIVVHFKKK